MAPKASSQKRRSLLLYSVFLAVFGVAYSFLGFPFPEELDGFGPKLEYYRQLFLHVTALSKDWDMEALNHAYFKHFEATGQKLPDMTNSTYAYHLEPLPELDPATDADWERKLSERVARGQATVVRKLMYVNKKLFPHAEGWNIDFFSKRVFPPGTLVPVFTDTMNDKSVILQEFSDYVAGLRNKSRKWYARCLDDAKHILRTEYDSTGLARLMQKEFEQQVTRKINDGQDYCIFVGAQHVSTRMHSDVTSSAFLMMQGRKRWVLFPPKASSLVVPFGHEMNVAYNSRLDVFAPKEKILAEYPFVSLAKGYEVIIEPGDVLFFSSFNWHAVQNLDDLTVGVDAGVVDGLHSWFRNAPLTLGTYGNLNALVKVVKGYFEGGRGLKQAFFQGYNLDEKEAKEFLKANGLY